MNEQQMQDLAGIIASAVTSGLAAYLAEGETAKVEAPKAPKADQPKADVRFRTAKAIEGGKAQADAIWAAAKAEAGVKRVAQLTPAQKKAAQAEIRTMWAGIKGTRKTKVA